MIEYTQGDATQPVARPAIIAHICNDAGGWGAGFVVAVSRRWDQPEKVYRLQSSLELGEVQFVSCGDGIEVANMIAQSDPRLDGPLVRYEALAECLAAVAELASLTGASIHMPRIGCGIGGGSWSKVEPIISHICRDIRVVVYDFAGEVWP